MNDRNLEKTIKSKGGNYMFWGCTSVNKVGNL